MSESRPFTESRGHFRDHHLLVASLVAVMILGPEVPIPLGSAGGSEGIGLLRRCLWLQVKYGRLKTDYSTEAECLSHFSC